MSWTQSDRERQAAKRAANIAAGLTAKGKPRKGRYKPSPTQQDFVTHGTPDYKRREPTLPKRGETPEQRRARGRALAGTPMARRLEASVRRRVEAMSD